MITYNRNILLTPSGKWYIPSRPYSISYATVPNGSFSGPSQAYGKDSVNVNSIPSSNNYALDYLTVNGNRIEGESFIMPYRNVVVSGAFKVVSNSITYATVSHGILSGPSQACGGDTVTVVSIPSSPNYQLDYITVNGNRITGNTFTMPYSDVVVSGAFKDITNPLNLPARTFRLKYKPGYNPSTDTFLHPHSDTDIFRRVSTNPNVWDVTLGEVYYANTIAEFLNANLPASQRHYDLLEVLGANTTGMTNMADLFEDCMSLTKVALFDTSSVTLMYYMFNFCESLTELPLFDTSSVKDFQCFCNGCFNLTNIPLLNTDHVGDIYLPNPDYPNNYTPGNVSNMFCYCYKVQSGALALYNQISSQHPSIYHHYCFLECGKDTTTGAAELAQIPSDWK